MIDAINVEKLYHQDGYLVKAVNRTSFHIPARTLATITGPSGSGKSSLLHLIGGIDRMDGGELCAAGERLQTLSERALANYRLTRVGFVFQAFHLIPNLTVYNNIALPALLLGSGERTVKERVHALLARLEMAGHGRKLPHQLSGGQQQRVAIARALVNDPPLILADEPTGNLDSQTGQAVIDLLLELHQQGKTLLIVTHDPDIAALGQQQLKMRDGELA